MRERLEDFFYKRIVKPLIFTSRLGRKSMFGYADSGINFDHIYKNEAKGYTAFGKLVDRILLSLPAAKATRYRKDKVIEILRAEIQGNIQKKCKTRIADIASGPARYLVDLITPELTEHVEALCLDIDRHSLEYGKQIAQDKPMLYKKANVLRIGARHKRLAQKRQWEPNVVVSSGLYEYLDDAATISSLKIIRQSLAPGGLFLLITQMDSPNKKLIEKVGVTKSGKKWVLFYRKPEVVLSLMVQAGFNDMSFEVDPWGMYVFYKGRQPVV